MGMMETRSYTRTHGGNPWALMRRFGFSKAEVLDFSVDVNPLGFPPSVPAIILEHMDDLGAYPDPDAHELREAIAAHHGIPTETILPGNGAAELIAWLARWQKAARVLVVVPTFGEYAWAAEQAGASCAAFPADKADGFRLDVESGAWPQALRGADLVFLCNPNNPTGTVLARDQILQLADRCREAEALLIVDEAFMEFVDRPALCSVVPDAASLGHVVVLRSLTKLFAVPGLRLGYAVGPVAIVEELRALQSPWPLNTFALAVGARLFRETAYVERSRGAIAGWREELRTALCAIPGLAPFPSATNFLLCKLAEVGMTSDELCERLARRGILIRNCGDFTGLEPGRFIRVAVRTQMENERLVGALREGLTRAA